MRQIVLDTETTGLLTTEGHRIIEIGCVELLDRQLTGNNFHHYVNPAREIEAGALSVHGITNEFLATKPAFADIIEDFLSYIQGAEIIAHNAEFDVGFINHEMRLLAKKKTLRDYVTVFDTLPHARKMFPGQRNSLDALCKRLKVDARERKFHGALLDAQLLAEVYLLMTGGQTNLFATVNLQVENQDQQTTVRKITTTRSRLPVINANNDELAEHHKIIRNIKQRSGKHLWNENND